MPGEWTTAAAGSSGAKKTNLTAGALEKGTFTENDESENHKEHEKSKIKEKGGYCWGSEEKISTGGKKRKIRTDLQGTKDVKEWGKEEKGLCLEKRKRVL